MRFRYLLPAFEIVFLLSDFAHFVFSAIRAVVSINIFIINFQVVFDYQSYSVFVVFVSARCQQNRLFRISFFTVVIAIIESPNSVKLHIVFCHFGVFAFLDEVIRTVAIELYVNLIRIQLIVTVFLSVKRRNVHTDKRIVVGIPFTAVACGQ